MQFLLVCEAPERGNARCNGSDTLLRCLKGKRSPKQAQDTNLSLPSSGNTKLQRDKCRAGELIQGSHCESQMCAPLPNTSAQTDRNNWLWHSHSSSSLLLHSPFFLFHFKTGSVTHLGEKRGHIALRHQAECCGSRMSSITVELSKIEAEAEYI